MARSLLDAPQASVDSDLVVILAGLLCALVCVLGLGLVTRCACTRRWAADETPLPVANKGVKKEVMRALPTVTYVSDVDGKAADECAICLAEFHDGHAMRVLPRCGHAFHAACVDAWLRSHSSCPSCRQLVLVAEQCRRCGARPGGIGALMKTQCSLAS